MVVQSPAPPTVTALNASQRVLAAFWDLANVEEAPRLAATQTLLADVLHDQAVNAPSEPFKQPEALHFTGAAKTQQLEQALQKCSPLMTYCLRRLAKGLGSSRDASRQGFATALTAVLAAASNRSSGAGAVLGCQEGLTLLDKCIESAGGSAKGGDVRDHLLGHLFGLGALVRGGLVREAGAARAVITHLLALTAKKAWLREAVVSVLLDLLLGGGAPSAQEGEGAGGVPSRWLSDAAVRDLLSTGPAGCPELRSFLSLGPKEASPEALLLALHLWPLMPADLLAASPLPHSASTPPPPVGFPQRPATTAAHRAAVARAASALFRHDYLAHILPALQETTCASPRLHSLWPTLLAFLLPGFTLQKSKADAAAGEEEGGSTTAAADPGQVEALWTRVVEGGLLTSSHDRKFLACQVFQVLLPRLTAANIPTVFTRNFCTLIAMNLKRPDSYLHAMTKRIMDRISQFMERSQDAAAKLAMSATLQRLANQGVIAHQVKSRATQKLAEGLDTAAVGEYLAHYTAAFLNPPSSSQQQANGQAAGSKGKGEKEEGEGSDDEDEEGESEGVIERQRTQSLDQVVAVLKMPAASEEQKAQVLRFLAAHAFFVAPPAPAPAPAKGKKGKAKEAAPPAQLSPELQQASHALQGGAPALSPATRLACAQRLLQHIASVPGGSPPSQEDKSSAKAGGKRKHEGGEGQDGEEEPAGKRAKKGDGSPRPVHVHVDPARMLGPIVAHVRGLQSGGAALLATELGEEAEAALTLLRELQDALEPLSAAPAGDKGAASGRARALCHLAALLQLVVMASPQGGTPDPSVLMDLRRAVQQSTGAQLGEVEEQVLDEGEGSGVMEEEGAGGEPGRPSWSEVLLDVVLSLMSRPPGPLPSSALRHVCESVWRASCEDLTLAGLQDLLRVVTAGLGPRGSGQDGGEVMGDGGDDDGEEEEEVEEEVGGSDDESFQGSDEDDGEEGEVDEGQVEALKAALKASGAAAGSDEESDGEDMDDEAMFRIEPKIAEYLRAAADQRRGAREAAEALAALRFKALTLLESFARKVPSSPLLLRAVVPLLRALDLSCRDPSSSSSSRLMAQRLHAVLSKAVCKAKPVYDADLLPVEEGAAPQGEAAGDKRGTGRNDECLPGALQRVRYLATRADDKAVAGAATSALAMLVASASAAGAPEKAAEAASSSLVWVAEDWAHKKRTRASLAGLKELVSRSGPASLDRSLLASLLKTAGGTARNAYIQAQALDLVAHTLQHLAAATKGSSKAAGGETSSQLFRLLKPHASALGAAVSAATSGGQGMKPDHHADAVKASIRAVEVCKRATSEAGRKLGELIGPEWQNAVVKAIATVRDLGASQKVDGQLTRLAQALGLADRLEGSQPDPALKARLLKLRVAAAANNSQQQAGRQKKKGQSSKEGAASKGSKGPAKGSSDKAQQQQQQAKKYKEGKGAAKGEKQGDTGKRPAPQQAAADGKHKPAKKHKA